jgi:predicted peroxiredoxin
MATAVVPIDKFDSEDLTKILAALHRAKAAKAQGSVTVHFDQHGGVVAVLREMKEKIK